MTLAAEQEYPLERNTSGSSRLYFQHYLWQRLLEHLLHPQIPIKEDIKIADIACGTGIWLLDLAKELANSNIRAQLDGFDISSAQYPPFGLLPSNVKLDILDIFEPVPQVLWEQYDVIHIGLLCMVICDGDPRSVLDNLLKLLKPGGYIQWKEVDFSEIYCTASSPDIPTDDLQRMRRWIYEVPLKKFPDFKWIRQLSSIFGERGMTILENQILNPEAEIAYAWTLMHMDGMKELVRVGASESREGMKLHQRAAEEVRSGACLSMMLMNVVGRKAGGDECNEKSPAALQRFWDLYIPKLPAITPQPVKAPQTSTSPLCLSSVPLISPASKPKSVLYLAYGSNLSAETFKGKRGIKPLSAVNVHVPEIDLTFDLAGIPYAEPFYEVTLDDYRTIIATEGGGASYKDELVQCFVLPDDSKTVDPNSSGEPFLAHTLLCPFNNGDTNRITRPDPDYAQPSSRYLKSITDGAVEHNLPEEYIEYLHGIRAYTVTTTRQKIARIFLMMVLLPIVLVLFGLGKLLADDIGKIPDWLTHITRTLLRYVWTAYDRVLKNVFGDGERTMEGTGAELGKSALDRWDEKISRSVSYETRAVFFRCSKEHYTDI
ncbi:hypothetical protein DID88_007633 [Monilinia fructigena]|uniref:gamma-glutamylcyclotransferase n=1 Tax=Monilinia fructigena TaxID=38457 RepID=A0A395J2Z3_9HELO|nr:hypothetical protein DID88_007633 [Monilinia fructigena]